MTALLGRFRGAVVAPVLAIAVTALWTTSDNHGVLNFGCRRRNTSGSCR